MRFPPASTSLYHYIDKVGLSTTPFPNPLAPDTSSTVVDLKGVSHYARTPEDLPAVFGEVAAAWDRTLGEHAAFAEMQTAIRDRDAKTIKRLWNDLVQRLDNQTFYGFLCDSPAFSSFRAREIFGQVGDTIRARAAYEADDAVLAHRLDAVRELDLHAAFGV